MLSLKSSDGRVAQLVEQCPFKAWVAGSNPAALTILPTCLGPCNDMAEALSEAWRAEGPESLDSLTFVFSRW